MSTRRWTKLFATDLCPPGKGRFVEAEGQALAVFHLSEPDRFIVTRNACPHAGGNLAAGMVEGNVVTCPWHHWPFNLDDGTCVLSEAVRLRQYPSRVADGHVYACLE